MKAPSLTFPVILLLVLAFANTDSFAANLIVTKTEDTADGVCDADCSLREAIVAAASGDTIVFSSLFDSPQTITLLNGQIAIAKSLTITGPGSGLLAVSGNNAGHILHISGGSTIAISGLWLRNGRVSTSADFNGGAVRVVGSTLSLSQVVMSHNYARFTSPPPNPALRGEGGAIWSEHSALTITDSEFYSNEAIAGAGITTWTGTLTVLRCLFRNNVGTAVDSAFKNSINVVDSSFVDNEGGGIIGGGDFTISGSVFSGNRGGAIRTGVTADVLNIEGCVISNNENTNGFMLNGGGIATYGTANIRNTRIVSNMASGRGGGVFNDGHLYISDSLIAENVALEGGGVYTEIFEVYLTNSTVSGNIAQKGGGVYNDAFPSAAGSRVFFTNVTVAFNRATAGKGGGLLQEPASNAVSTLKNSVFANNTSSLNEHDVSAVVVSGGHNLIRAPSGSSGWVSSDVLNVDPILAPLASNGGDTLTHALRPGSPSIDAGSNALAVDPLTMLPLKTDQRGRQRVIGGDGGIVDIGAYEANYSSTPVSIAGRVLTSTGRALPSARVSLRDDGGVTLYAITNPFGYYRFLNLPVGMTYNITASHKLYTFSLPIVVTTDQDRDDLIFFGMF